MENDQIFEGLRLIFSEVFMRDDIVLCPEMTSDDIDGWDSMKMIEIILGCEERFNVNFSSKELDELVDVGALYQVIRKRINYKI